MAILASGVASAHPLCLAPQEQTPRTGSNNQDKWRRLPNMRGDKRRSDRLPGEPIHNDRWGRTRPPTQYEHDN